MIHRLACLLVACIAFAWPLSARSADPPSSPADEAAIRAVVDGIAQAWNAHDMQAYARLFTRDADWVNIRGNRWQGVDAIRAEHVAVHDRFYRRSRLTFDDVTVRMVAPGVAVVHAKETIRDSDVPARANISPESQMSLVIVKDGAAWRIASGQNTNIAPPPAASPAPPGGKPATR